MYPILDTRVECKGTYRYRYKNPETIRIEPDWNVKNGIVTLELLAAELE